MSVSDEKYIKELVTRYKAGEANPAELQALFGLIGEDQFDQLLEQDMDEEIEKYLDTGQENPRQPGNRWLRYFAAASVFLFCCMGIYLYQKSSSSGNTNVDRTLLVKTDIEPGADRATLTLADGSSIDLNKAGTGAIAGANGVKILKSKSGQLIYQIQEQDQGEREQVAAASYNTITTPRGGQWQVILPDGSRVWLNAASSLRYPTRFSEGEREVTLTGEAYFEIARKIRSGKREPFLVMTANQKIEVLGTHFNVNAYSDEQVVRTTLLEGKVRLSAPHSSASIDLKPGFEAMLEDQHFTVAEADVQTTLAWKNGDFIFDGQDVRATMRQIARWYDVDVIYQDMPDKLPIGGTISRANKLSVVLKALELTGKVKVKVEGRRITLSR